MMDTINQDFGNSEQCIDSHIQAEEEMLENKGEHVIEFISCIKEEPDDESYASSPTDYQCTQLEAAIKEEPTDSYLGTGQELQFVSEKEEISQEPPVSIGEIKADIFDDCSSPMKSVNDNADNDTKEDGESCPSVNGASDLNGDSDRFLQEENEHKAVESTPNTVRKRRGRKPRYDRNLSDKPFQCKICDKCFRTSEHLHCHEAFHSEERPFSCDTCGKGFVTNGDLKRHRVVHTREKPYACPNCPKTFTQSCNMQAHLRKRCQSKQYGCDLCDRMFKEPELLQKHRARHGTVPYYVNKKRKKQYCQDSPPFICDVCSQCFSDKRTLIAHVKAHFGLDKVTCDICGKNCTRKERLIVHMRSHTGEKPFSCNVCGRSFTQQCNLKKHEVLHLPD